MAKGRKSKTYVEGPRKQMTLAWKLLVHAKLKANKKDGIAPGSVGALSKLIPCDKAGLTRALNPDQDPPQMAIAEAYMERICELLKIGPPLVESSGDAQLEKQTEIFRSMSPEVRAMILDPELMKLIAGFAAKKR